ncbi:unnamed protein product [Bursaphelenchus xylophilus]|uniref:(pine wood nematode) hypothetical protein n=1 Tax=Bursaphelenchus xylophilus TaxID=6326 RepID=A0A7I8WYK4_BURXY|nr:unnamed protein product [Bursaphelenchus xylophilus]CAG9101496.1 unnamed protein product [Bursaphelenchus xylophilus]
MDVEPVQEPQIPQQAEHPAPEREMQQANGEQALVTLPREQQVGPPRQRHDGRNRIIFQAPDAADLPHVTFANMVNSGPRIPNALREFDFLPPFFSLGPLQSVN